LGKVARRAVECAPPCWFFCCAAEGCAVSEQRTAGDQTSSLEAARIPDLATVCLLITTPQGIANQRALWLLPEHQSEAARRSS
jgi:hypothetical protein